MGLIQLCWRLPCGRVPLKKSKAFPGRAASSPLAPSPCRRTNSARISTISPLNKTLGKWTKPDTHIA
jgi:hypothetical protein